MIVLVATTPKGKRIMLYPGRVTAEESAQVEEA
jgi:hypothetical protein